MSKEPADTKDFNGRKYYCLELKIKDWCCYPKECQMDNNINGNYCHACKYQRKLDIPTLMAEKGKS